MTHDLLEGDQTAKSLTTVPIVDRTLTTSERLDSSDLAQRFGMLRGGTRLLAADVVTNHQEALSLQLQQQTNVEAKRPVVDMLNRLARLGLSWRDIAGMMHVSVPALRNWRMGESPTGPHRKSLAELVAFVDILGAHLELVIDDVASWLEMPLGDSPITGIDLYTDGHAVELLAFAAEHVDAVQLLDICHPAWREEIDTQFEVFTGADRHPSLRPREH